VSERQINIVFFFGLEKSNEQSNVRLEIICDLACDACERKLRQLVLLQGLGGRRYFHRVDVKLDAWWLYVCKHTIAEQTERVSTVNQSENTPILNEHERTASI
jgi:hypothetical protein